MFGLGCFWGAEEVFWQTDGRLDHRGRVRRRVHAAPVVRGGLLRPHRAHRGRPRRLRPEGRQLRAARRDLLRGARPDAGHAAGQRHRHAVPLGDLLHHRRAARGRRAGRALFGRTLDSLGYGAVTTEVAPAGEFYYAEGYHQQYLAKNPNGYRCHSTTGVRFPLDELTATALTPSDHYPGGMPELPEVEALASFLRERATGRAVQRADVAAFSAVKTFDPPLTALQRRSRQRRLAVREVPLARLRRAAPGHPSRPGRMAAVARVVAAGAAASGRQEPARLPAASRAGVPGRSGRRLRPHRDGDAEAARGLSGARTARGAGHRAARARTRSRLSLADLTELFAGHSAQLKGALTDQALIAGIGNAYSDEILHVAKLSPFKNTASSPRTSWPGCTRRSAPC